MTVGLLMPFATSTWLKPVGYVCAFDGKDETKKMIIIETYLK